MAEYIAPIKRLIEEFRKLPGVGAKTAVRYAFATLALDENELEQFADAIIGASRDVRVCPVCCGLTASEDKCESALKLLKKYIQLVGEKAVEN